MKQHPSANWPFVALLGGALGIGFAPIWVRLSQVGPSATGFYRLLLALPFLWAWYGSEKPNADSAPAVSPNQPWAKLALAGFFFAGDLAFWHWSIRWTTVANSTLFANCAPLFVTLGAWLLYRETITARFVLGLAMALAGCLILAQASFSFDPRRLAGDGLGLVTALFYAGYMLTLKSLRNSCSTPKILAWAGLVTCPLLWLAAYLSGETLVPPSAAGWWTLLGLAVTSHVGGQGLIAYAMGHLSASFLSLTLLLQPLVAAILARFILAEGITARQWCGGAVVLAGIMLAGTNAKSASVQPAAAQNL